MKTCRCCGEVVANANIANDLVLGYVCRDCHSELKYLYYRAADLVQGSKPDKSPRKTTIQ